jgi:hypothetical protein
VNTWRKALVLTFAGICSLLFSQTIESDGPWSHNVFMLTVVISLLAPAIALSCGVRWCKYPFGIATGLFLVVWTFSPAAQHSIDRSIFFWLFWAAIEGLAIGALIAVFIQPRVPATGKNT